MALLSRDAVALAQRLAVASDRLRITLQTIIKKLQVGAGQMQGHASNFFGFFERYLVIASLITHAMLSRFSSAIFPSSALSSAAMLRVILSTSSPATGWRALKERFFIKIQFASFRCIRKSETDSETKNFENPKPRPYVYFGRLPYPPKNREDRGWRVTGSGTRGFGANLALFASLHHGH